ncbi:MAG: hypothetical protein JWN44_3494 [Myxococcales bacterium]|nr:hypothetical protein [Myxococcales bacterium]
MTRKRERTQRETGMARLPAPPALFLGRDAERRRLLAQLGRVPVACVSGVAGVGKTALAYAVAADWPAPAVYRRAQAGEPLASLLDDARRALAGGAVRERDSDDERLDELAHALDADGALLIVDDLHLVADADRDALLSALGAQLRRGRLLVTSRERLVSRRGADRVELRLEGLDEANARALWASLDNLYGTSAGFEVVWARSFGNPLTLRQAHAGDLGNEDPIADVVASLSAAELRMASLLALAAVRLPGPALVERAGRDGRAVIASLVRKMIAESDATGLCVHDAFRAPILACLDVPTERARHGELAELVQGAALDAVVRGREVTRHLVRAGRVADAGTFLVAHAADFIRNGAAHELLRAYDTIPAAERSPAVTIARARTLTRALDVRAAHDELARLSARGVEDVELDLALAQSAMLTAELRVAESAVARALARPRVTPEQLVRAQTTQALVSCHLGRGDEARAQLEAASSRTSIDKHRAHLMLTHAFTLWLDERAGPAERFFAQARALYEGDTTAYQSVALAVPLLAALLARLGHADEARRVEREAETLIAARGGDRLLVSDVRFLRAGLSYDLGERRAALDAFAACQRSFDASGQILGSLMARAWRGRVLHALGRRKQAQALLAATRAEAEVSDVPSVLALVDRARLADPLHALADLPANPSGESSESPAASPRRRVLAALQAAGRGDARAVEQLLAPTRPWLSRADYALDAAIAHLARATLALVDGDARRANREHRRAEALALAHDIDADLLTELARRAGDRRATPTQAAAATVMLDGRSHELRWPGGHAPLARRPALRRLLYALAGGTTAKTALAVALWGQAYKPSTHDNALWMNVTRLRKLVAPAGLGIEATDGEYRLVAADGFVFVAPAVRTS